MLLLLLLALFLFPIAVYCTVLGLMNRRSQPLMVSGAWDFVGVLVATSGFLLFVGPAMLSGTFRQSLRELPFSRDSPSLAAAVEETWAAWWVAWILYYVFVLGGAALLVWLRRRTTVIYNVDPPTLETALARTAQRLGLAMHRLGNRVFLAARQPVPTTGSTEVSAELLPPLAQPPRWPSEQVVMDVEAFSMLSNVSLHWRSGSPEARADLKRELERSLAEVVTPDSAVGAWLLTIAAFLYLVILMLTAVFVMGIMMTARP